MTALLPRRPHRPEDMRPAPHAAPPPAQGRRHVRSWLWFRAVVPRSVRALLYMVLVGGAWLVVVPAGLVLVGPHPLPVAVRAPLLALAGLALLVVGGSLALWAGYDLIVRGQGTPFPLDPTTVLVTEGLYGWVRNPQAMAMTLMVAGEVLALQAPRLWLPLPLLLAFLEGLARPWEQRQLTKAFGDQYCQYRARVPRWLPRRPGPRGAPSSAQQGGSAVHEDRHP